MNSKDEGFLGRWAKRKQQVRELEEREAELQPIVESVEPSVDGEDTSQQLEVRDTPPDDETRQRWIEELEAIDIDALTYDNDFTIYMKSWVPGPLRQRALRKLWGTNPALAVLDGLNDYDLDYTDKAMQAGTVISSYIPGRGYASLEEVIEKVAGLTSEEEGAGEDDMPAFEDEELQADAMDTAKIPEETARSEAESLEIQSNAQENKPKTSA